MLAKTVAPAVRGLVGEMHPRPIPVVAVGTAGGNEAIGLPVSIQLLDHGICDSIDSGLACLTMHRNFGFAGHNMALIDCRRAFNLADKTRERRERVAVVGVMLHQAA